MRVLTALVLMALGAAVQAQLTVREKALVDEALFARNWRRTDLDSARRSKADNQFMPLVGQMLDTPLAAADRLLELQNQASTGSSLELLLQAMRAAYPDEETGAAAVPGAVDVPGLRGELKTIVGGVAAAMSACNAEIEGALAALSTTERAELQRLLVARSQDMDGAVRPSEVARMKSLLARVDLPRIRSASVALTSATDEAVEQLRRTVEDVSGPIQLSVAGINILLLPRSGSSVDVQTADLVIVLGGHNTLSGRLAAGVQKAGVLIDLGDDSSYFTRDFGLGAGVLGVGYAYVGVNRASAITGNGSVGAGIGGVGIARFEGVEVRSTAAAMSQGFGSFGIGLCIDQRSDSTWRATRWAQGAARTQGIGWLVDRGGNDLYVSTGVKTLSRTTKRSASQGYSAGYGYDLCEDPGGIGLLTDLGGDDVYQAESDSQGAADWRGLGSLFDKSGNDRYLAAAFSQGAASHQSSALMVDAAGDDTQLLASGAGQGAAAYDSVALWLDREGDVQLVSSGPGSGYATPDSLALRIKPAGRITASENTPGKSSDGAMLAGAQATRGGVDLSVQSLLESLFPSGPRIAFPSAPVPSPASSDPGDLSAVFDRAAMGDSLALSLLVATGKKGLDFAVRNRLANADGMDRQVIAFLAQRQGDAAASSFSEVGVAQDEATLTSALLIGARVKSTDLSGLVPRVIREKPNLAPLALNLVAENHANDVVGVLLPLLASSDPRTVRLAMATLERVSDSVAAGSAQAVLIHEDPCVRESAARLLAQFPSQAQVAAEALLANGDPFVTRVGIHVLGLVGTPESMIEVAALLHDRRPEVRFGALSEFIGRVSPQVRRELPALQNDPDPRVKSLAKSLS